MKGLVWATIVVATLAVGGCDQKQTADKAAAPDKAAVTSTANAAETPRSPLKEAAIAEWPIDHVVGKPDAPITVVEYSSLSCPHCADFHIKTFPQFKTEWLDTGKAKLIFRDFPLNPPAEAAAMVAQCAGDRYFTFIDVFFRSQDTWLGTSDMSGAIKNIAKLGGIGAAQVDQCWNDKALMDQINARKQEGADKFGVDSTPSFLIHGKIHSGALSYDELVKLLN